ncbi:bile Acid:Na+ symporter family [Ectocarpus siliculosus]|uniref:Bile Acid:Na+ symporter family n=1 Tax=Ectocarpus siliculosus TaxID=2880 RepID=D8LAT3_ECTSI|nr:bile Acid:Na+ symporter family [Ectocarpus siliculosus]|eukprot:CBN76442.1 bile Acid:Na+ symporter family [Ectocarpus siliculosus]
MLLAGTAVLPLIVPVLLVWPPGGMASTSKSYEKARASVEKATGHFADVQTISAKDVLRLEQEGKKVLLVDVRTEDEMKVSMLRGALTREEFENSSLGEAARTGKKFRERSGEGEEAWGVVAPYCTVGFRSGQYAKKLVDLGYPSVRNSEGVVLWTHDVGNGLVARAADEVESGGSPGSGPRNGSGVEVKRLHVFGSPWDHASDDFETIKFTATGWFGSTVKSAFSKMFKKKKT